MSQFSQILVVMVIMCCIKSIQAHGKLADPVSRSSMWRLGYKTPQNYEDNQLFCGGVQVQYEKNGGKCGVCGDPYDGARENEVGGKYANGIIVRNYTMGQLMKARVDLTANHKGWFMFDLCPKKRYEDKETEECFEKHPLKIATTGAVHFPVKGEWGSKSIVVPLNLPKNVACNFCVFRWKYNAGNSWGVDPVTKKGCVGCGNQEQFYGCADIKIFGDSIAAHSASLDGSWVCLVLAMFTIFYQTGTR